MEDTEAGTSEEACCSATMYLFVATVLVLFYFLYNQFGGYESWEKYGVKQVKMGAEGYADFRDGYHNLVPKHGDTVGIHMGGMILITRDFDILRTVMVKEFNNFVNRVNILATTSAIDKSLFFLEDQDWKRMRHILSPSFSTGKLKMFSKSMDESAKKLTKVLEDFARRDALLPIKFTSGQYTSEIIARLAFGLQTDCLGKEDDEFTHYSKTMFKIRNKFTNVVIILLFLVPRFHKFIVKQLKLRFFDNINTDADVYFNTVLHRTVAERQENARKGDRKYTDFLQTLVTAKEEGDKAVEAAALAGHDINQASENLPKTMSDEELIGQAMLIIFAGFETTSTALQMCLYMLAKHPDIQEKVYEEIKATVASETPTYEELGNLKYLQQVIDETLRLYPPASFVTRIAAKTTTIGSVTIPKDAKVIIPLDLIGMNSRHFPNPEKFDPDRFSEENKAKMDPMSFIPFGYGPRICIGMRLAYLELKLGLVHVLRKIRVELNQRTEPKEGGDINTTFQGFIVVEKPIMLAVSLRNSS